MGNVALGNRSYFLPSYTNIEPFVIFALYHQTNSKITEKLFIKFYFAAVSEFGNSIKIFSPEYTYLPTYLRVINQYFSLSLSLSLDEHEVTLPRASSTFAPVFHSPYLESERIRLLNSHVLSPHLSILLPYNI